MKVKMIALLAVTVTALSAWSQVPTPGFGDKGCSDKPLFAQKIPVTREDYIEVHQFQSYARSEACLHGSHLRRWQSGVAWRDCCERCWGCERQFRRCCAS